MDPELLEMCDCSEVQKLYFDLERKCPFDNEDRCDPFNCVDSCYMFKEGDYYWEQGYHIKGGFLGAVVNSLYGGNGSVANVDKKDSSRLCKVGSPENLVPGETTIFIPHDFNKLLYHLKGTQFTVTFLANGLLEIDDILDTPIKALLKAFMGIKHNKAWEDGEWRMEMRKEYDFSKGRRGPIIIKIVDIDVITKHDVPTKAGIDLMRMVHEGMDMGCWHKHGGTRTHKENARIHIAICGKCKGDKLINPSYLTSLDAWRPVWDKMTEEQLGKYTDTIITIDGRENIFSWQMYPHHHLEALASVLEVECWCKGDTFPIGGGHMVPCPECKGTGKRKLIDVWKEKHEE